MATDGNIISTGSDSCPCIDASNILSSLNRSCAITEEAGGTTDNGASSVTGICYPPSYGSDYCYSHDFGADPACRTTNNKIQLPDYCYDSWCYVDLKKCLLSEEVVSRSDLFPMADLFFSYSTCNSSAAAYEDYITTLPLTNRTLKVTVPGIYYAHHYKLDNKGTVAPFAGSEYYNESIQFQGSFIDYMNSVVEVSNNIKGVEYVVKSKGSERLFSNSAFTAAVNDVRAGLSDMALGSFWVTTERLQLTTFTIPIHTDKNVLVVEKPAIDRSFGYQTAQLFKPFELELWMTLLASIFFAALLGVWFTSPKAKQSLAWLKFRKVKWREASFRRRVVLVFRLILDGILEKGTYFCNGEVAMDPGASLPNKLLMFGFSFLILVSVSAYVANLAAFLTLSGVDDGFVGTVTKAIDLHIPICVNSVLRNELTTAWPKANFVFVDFTTSAHNASGYPEIDFYDQGKCKALIVSIFDYYSDTKFHNLLCQRNLAMINTETFLEIPVAFPINNQLAAGFSSYMIQQKDQGNTLLQFEDKYKGAANCDVNDIAIEEDEDGGSLTLANMAFAFIFFAVFATAAMIIQLYISLHDEKSSKNNGGVVNDVVNSLGRTSQLWSHFEVSEHFVSTKNLEVESDDTGEQTSFHTKDDKKKKVASDKHLGGCDEDFAENEKVQFKDESDFIENKDNLKGLASRHCTTSEYEENDNTDIREDEQNKFVSSSSLTPFNNCSFTDDQSYSVMVESAINKFENAMAALKKIEDYSNSRQENNKEHQS